MVTVPIYWKKEWRPLAAIVSVFVVCLYLPVGRARFDHAVLEGLHLVQWYAHEHVLLCLAPAFFIAGAIAVFVRQTSVMKYLGAEAPKTLAYGVAAVSGTILAVCSCTVLPLFAGIYRMGAGLGPATAFLYSGPAINVLAIILTARVLGPELGIARAVGAITFSVVIGILMHLIFRKEAEPPAPAAAVPEEAGGRPLWQTGLYFAAMVAVLVFANWGEAGPSDGLWHAVYTAKWGLTAAAAFGLGVLLVLCFGLRWWKVTATVAVVGVAAMVLPSAPELAFTLGIVGLALAANSSGGEMQSWLSESWSFAKQILPLLFLGVLVAGLLLGRPGHEGLIPTQWVTMLAGGNSLRANLFASVVGALMYFATLTEIPILEGLLEKGMGKGPALALLLAGPALSLPNMLVIRSVIGTKKTAVFVLLVVVMATLSGMVFGALSN